MNFHCASLVFCTSLLFSACGSHHEQQFLGTLERDRLELVAEANEPIIEVLHREGDAVKAGTVLLRLDLGAMTPRLEQARAARSEAEHHLAELVKGPRAQEILEARAGLEAARSTAATEAAELARTRNLFADHLVPRADLDQAQARHDSAQGAQKQAQARLNLLLEGTRVEAVEQAEAQVRQADAELAQLDVSAKRYQVTAPRDGHIEALPYKLGERPPVGAPIVVMLADGTPYARVYVPENHRAQFLPNTRVAVHVDGVEKALSGSVRFVSAEAAFTPYYALTQEDRTQLSYVAEIDLVDSAARNLPSGIPVQVDSSRAQ
jgi:HlyD family secretion protein